LRTISQASLNALSETTGVEPVNFIDIDWSGAGQYVRYSDQSYPGVIAKILSLGNVENVVNLSGNTSSQNVNLKLDDTDGSLKYIIDTIDIHKKNVKIYQWFKSIPMEEAFVIFDGEISSPIVWSEHERTLTFDVVSKLDDMEVGFSAEEGDFEYIPPAIMGKAWPLIFGTVYKVPCIRINEIPTGAITDTIGIDEHSIDLNAGQRIVTNNVEAHRKALRQAASCFILALRCMAAASYYRFRQQVDVATVPSDWYTGIDYTSLILQLDQQADQLQDQGNEFLAQANEIALNMFTVYDTSPAASNVQKSSVQMVNGQQFPQGTTIALGIKGNDGTVAYHEGIMEGTNFTITKQISPLSELGIISAGPVEVTERGETGVRYQSQVQVQKLWIAQGGSTVTISQQTTYPIRYIACMNWCTVAMVWAQRTFNESGITQIFPVPNTYYQVDYEDFGAVKATLITMYRPLSSYVNEGWSDEIFIDLISPVGPNVVDIMIWLIQTYTKHTYDPVSFAHVYERQINYPANFALTNRPNIIVLLQEIAFQCRCAIWYNNGIFYLRYLSEQTDPTETFVDDDIEFGSISLECTPTEEVVTKITATWQPDYYVDPYKLVFRSNIPKYGVMPEDYNFYIYNQQVLVEKSAIFWMIRKSNVWKRVKFDTFLTKLRVETYDMILLNFSEPVISNSPVVALVESVAYDSDNQRLTITVWVPIRWGEMDQYIFALPADIAETIILPVPKDLPGQGTKGKLFDQNPVKGTAPSNYTRPYPTAGSNAHYDHGPIAERDPAIADPPDANNNTGIRTFAGPSYINSSFKLDKPINTTHNQWQVKDRRLPTIQFDKDGVYPGYVSGKIEGNRYAVDIYPLGLDQAPTRITVIELSGQNVPNGAGVIVNKNVLARQITGAGFTQQVQYTMVAASAGGSGMIPGRVVEGSADTYSVDLYENGWSQEPTQRVTVQQLDIDPDDTVPAKTAVMVTFVTTKDSEGNTMKSYYMQVPVWLAELEV
jgi:hypothetical protein